MNEWERLYDEYRAQDKDLPDEPACPVSHGHLECTRPDGHEGAPLVGHISSKGFIWDTDEGGALTRCIP